MALNRIENEGLLGEARKRRIRRRRENHYLRPANTEVERILFRGHPHIHVVLFAGMHAIVNNEYLVAEYFRDLYPSTEREKVRRHDTIAYSVAGCRSEEH